MSKTSIRCAVTGISKAVRPEIYNQRIEKYGGEDEMLQKYISRDSKRLLRDGKTVDQIRKDLNVDAAALNLPSAADLADEVAKIMEKPNSKLGSSKKKEPKVDTSLDEVGQHDDADANVKALLGVIEK